MRKNRVSCLLLVCLLTPFSSCWDVGLGGVVVSFVDRDEGLSHFTCSNILG